MSQVYTSKAMTKIDIRTLAPRLCKFAFFVMFVGFVFMLFLGHYFRVGFPVALYLVAVAMMCVVADRSELIALAISCSAFPAVFQYRYAVILIMAAYFIKNIGDFYYSGKGSDNNYAPLLLLFAMIFWEVLHVAVYAQSAIEYLRSIVELLFIFMLLVENRKKYDYPKIVRYVSFAALSSCVLILLIQMKFGAYKSIVDYFSANRFGYGVEKYGDFDANFNPNGLALICVVSVCALVHVLLSGKSKFIDIIFIFALFIFSLMTMSRKVILMYALLFLFVFFNLLNVKKRGILKSILILVLTALAMVLALKLLNDLLPTVMERFSERLSTEDISNGRLDLFEEYNALISSDIGVALFGWGIQGIDAFHKQYGIVNVTHNGTQEIIVCWGITGLIMFALMLLIFFKRVGKGKKIGLLNCLLLAEVLLFAQFAQLIRSSGVMMFLAYAYVAMTFDGEKNRLKNGNKSGYAA